MPRGRYADGMLEYAGPCTRARRVRYRRASAFRSTETPPMMKLVTAWLRIPFWQRVVAGFVLGALAGWLLGKDAQTWFGPLITFGEMAVGLGLIFGILTGFAAFFGSLMNMSFMLAGSASSNPVLFTLAIGLILAWKVAGYYGVDRWLLPMLGTPWHPAVLSGKATGSPGTTG